MPRVCSDSAARGLIYYIYMKIEIEANEIVIDLVNEILYQITRNKDSVLSQEEREELERFRLDMILPYVVSSEYPIQESFAKYFGRKIEEIKKPK
jgi:hypothetical protein